jgi:hypothetical protein
LSPGSPAGTSTAQEVEANDQFARLFRGERLRTQHLERECAAEMARADYAEARIRRLFVGINSAQVVSKERVRIRALEKNLEAVARKYSMEKELHKEVTRMYSKAKESHEEMRLRFVGYIDRVYEGYGMKFEDNRIPYRVRMWYAEKEREEREEFMRLFEEKYKSLFEGKLITTREDVLKDIEVNVERTKNAMRKDVQEKAAIIIERDDRIDMLEKHLDKTCVERDCALATIAERDERIASLEKQLATTRALLYASGPRNQQGQSQPSA